MVAEKERKKEGERERERAESREQRAEREREPKNGASGMKQKREHHHSILHIQINLGTKFQLKLTILICWTKFAKKRVSCLKQKKWTPPLNPAFSNSLSTKFELKLSILIFWIKFVQKGYFQSTTNKMDTTIEFYIFELVQVPNFSLNW